MDLTSIEPFALGPFEVAPARCEIAHEQAVTRVEPKVMAVLIALARRRGETVSREKLFEEVWEGRAVTDDALTRCISALRRVFRDGQGVEIKALPKLGYVLAVETAAANTSTRSVTPHHTWYAPPFAVAAAVFALVVATTAVLSFRMPPAPQAGANARITPLTSLPGIERYPALGPGGGQLAFAHRDADGQWDLYVKSLAPGGQPQRLTEDGAREQHPVWSSTGDELVYIRSTEDACELMRVAVPGGTPRKVVDCGGKVVHSLDWSPDGRLFALTRSDARLAPASLAFIALEGTAPAAATDPRLGAEDARFSPDGKQVALTLSTAIGAEDVYTIDLASGRLDRITNDNAKVHGLDWTTDGQAIVYASNRSGSFGLNRVTPGGAPVSLQPSLQDIEGPSVSGARVAYEVWTETGGLNALKLIGDARTPQLPPDSTRLEWHPTVAADGAMAFVSDRGGAPEVWLSLNGAARQLTFFGDAYIHTPKFSPDGQTIAFSAPRAGRFGLFLVGREGTLRRLTEGDANDMSPAWAADGRTVYFASDRGGVWRPWKLDIATGQMTLIANTPARAVYLLNKDKLLLVDPVKGGIYRLALSNPTAPPRVLAADTAPSDWANVLVVDQDVFYVRREPPDRAVLRRIHVEPGKDEALADIEDFYFRSGLALAGGSLIYATTRVEDVALMLFEERPQTAQVEEERNGKR
jgi:Tol biopolymer transport system component/DNA-binding winged helix-turn-helix (wHTH) protein